MRNTSPEEWLSAVAASRVYGVSTRTLRRYTDAGKLPDVRGGGGRRMFRRGDLDVMLLNRKGDRTVAYARVSSRRQQAEGDLDRQIERLRAARECKEMAVFTDIASGLSDRRTGLRRALSECMAADVHVLVVEHPDRLARFGVGVIEHLLSGFGVTVVYTGEPDNASVESELVRDMLAIVTSFAGRLYGQSSAATKRLRQAVATETGRTDGGPS